MTFLTFGAKWPGRGASGLAGSRDCRLRIADCGFGGAATPSRDSNSLSAIAPMPTPHWPKKCRRVCDCKLRIANCELGLLVMAEFGQVSHRGTGAQRMTA